MKEIKIFSQTLERCLNSGKRQRKRSGGTEEAKRSEGTVFRMTALQAQV
jgi:hypothetical protein